MINDERVICLKNQKIYCMMAAYLKGDTDETWLRLFKPKLFSKRFK